MHAAPDQHRNPALFLGGALSGEQLRVLLLHLIPAEPTDGWPAVVASLLRGICQGADRDFSAPQALLKALNYPEWRSLEDSSLFRGELHSLLVDGKCQKFADRLARNLDKSQQPWLERCWPVSLYAVPTADHPARVTAMRVMSDRSQEVVSADAEGEVRIGTGVTVNAHPCGKPGAGSGSWIPSRWIQASTKAVGLSRPETTAPSTSGIRTPTSG